MDLPRRGGEGAGNPGSPEGGTHRDAGPGCNRRSPHLPRVGHQALPIPPPFGEGIPGGDEAGGDHGYPGRRGTEDGGKRPDRSPRRGRAVGPGSVRGADHPGPSHVFGGEGGGGPPLPPRPEGEGGPPPLPGGGDPGDPVSGDGGGPGLLRRGLLQGDLHPDPLRRYRRAARGRGLHGNSDPVADGPLSPGGRRDPGGAGGDGPIGAPPHPADPPGPDRGGPSGSPVDAGRGGADPLRGTGGGGGDFPDRRGVPLRRKGPADRRGGPVDRDGGGPL